MLPTTGTEIGRSTSNDDIFQEKCFFVTVTKLYVKNNRRLQKQNKMLIQPLDGFEFNVLQKECAVHYSFKNLQTNLSSKEVADHQPYCKNGWTAVSNIF